jgi:hypothetical protein
MMRRTARRLLAASAVFGALILTEVPCSAKEFLTDKEIEKIQDNQEIDKRVKIYLEAAALRLKTAEERLNGKESLAGEPMEFFSVEDMLEGYFLIIRSIMLNLDGAVQNPGTDRAKLEKALKALKDDAGRRSKDLEILKTMAEDRKMEQAWDLVNKAIEVTTGALEGSELGLAQFSSKKK